MRTQPIHFDDEIRGDVAILTVRGDLAVKPNVSPFHTRIRQLVESGATGVVVDLSSAKRFGAAMLGELIAALKIVRNAGGDMRLTGVTKAVDTILKATQLTQILKTQESVDKAVASIHRKVLSSAA